MAEFREQDSYINSDYDSDSTAEDSSSVNCSSSPAPLRNSIITQVESLVRASQMYPRPKGFPQPSVTYVLNRLEEFPEGGYEDLRIQATFRAVRDMGITLLFGSQNRSVPRKQHHRVEYIPTKRILLDLSVVVALCCDSTHHPLPANDEELEARFRPLQLVSGGNLELVPHTNVSKDLRDQLDWEAQHPLILEIQQRLSPSLADEGGSPEFWVTQEVKDRLPAIVDLIGGEKEKARAKALFDGLGFWDGSRWQGKAGILEGIQARILDDDEHISPTLEFHSFRQGLIAVCQTMLDKVEPTLASTITSSRTASPSPTPRKTRRSKHPKRTTTIFPGSRLPSAHTLRTLVTGVLNNTTVLTNNRGAVGKVIREMGVPEGLPWDEFEDGRIVVWVVNPSSLAEWRREEVEEGNRVLIESCKGKAKSEENQE